MEIKYELQYKFGLSALLILIISLGSIGLFLRMSPAIETILGENEVALEASERMLAALLRANTAPEDNAAELEFDAALAEANKNATDAREEQVLAIIESHKHAAFEGNTKDLKIILYQLRELTEINRKALHKNFQKAQRLGMAGAWGVMILGIVGFTFAILTASRVHSHVVQPLLELYDTLRASEKGEPSRRATASPDAPSEIIFIQRGINTLLDRAGSETHHAAPPVQDPTAAPLVLALLDRFSEPLVVTERNGEVRFANHSATDALLSDEGKQIRKALQDSAAGLTTPLIESAHQVAQGACTLVQLKLPALPWHN